MNVLKSSPGLKSSETWLPLCLPKFNPNGFVYALIDYVKENIGLIFVSADREGFEALQTWKLSVIKVSLRRLLQTRLRCLIPLDEQKLEEDNMINKLELAGLADPYLSGEQSSINAVCRDQADDIVPRPASRTRISRPAPFLVQVASERSSDHARMGSPL